MRKTRMLFAALAPLAMVACGQTSQSPSVSAPVSAPVASGAAAAPAGAAQSPESSSNAQPIASATVAAAKLSGQACSLDTIDGSYDTRVTLDKGKLHTFRGWLENNQQKSAGGFQVVLVGDKDFAFDAHTGVARPDVASGQHNPALADAGFNVAVSLGSLPNGEYAVRYLMQASGTLYWCDVKKSVVLR